MLNGELGIGDVDPVANVVGVLDEDEDAGTQNFSSCRCKDERKGKKCRAGSSEGGDERVVDESNYV